MGRRETAFIFLEAYCRLACQGVCRLLWNLRGWFSSSQDLSIETYIELVGSNEHFYTLFL